MTLMILNETKFIFNGTEMGRKGILNHQKRAVQREKTLSIIKKFSMSLSFQSRQTDEFGGIFARNALFWKDLFGKTIFSLIF